MDQDYSFPICVQLAPPPSSSMPKSRAKSMSNDEPPVRKHFHAHRRSAAVSEDLRGVVIPTIRQVTEGASAGSASATSAGSASAPSTPGYGAFGVPHGAMLEVPEGALGAPGGVPPSPKAAEDRKVAFAAPPPPLRTPNPDSPRSSQFSPRSPFRSPRRRTLSVFVDDEPPCIDLDEALYSHTLHRRTESLPVSGSGLNSPFLPPPREIEPVLEEEDEHSQIYDEQAVESPEQSPVKESAKIVGGIASTSGGARAPRRLVQHAAGSTPTLGSSKQGTPTLGSGTPNLTPILGTPASTFSTPLDRPSTESARSVSSGLSEASIDSKKAKRFSFLRSLSPRLRPQSPPARAAPVNASFAPGGAGSGAVSSPRARKLRDIPSVSSLGIPDSIGSGVYLPSTPASDSFALGEPGPAVAPDKKKRWSFFRR